MSKSRERRVKGFNKATVRRVEDLPREARTPAGQAGRLAAPSPESLMTFVKAQTCPWCGSGPYKLLANHTHRAHGVSAADLREMAGLIKTAVICSPEVSEKSRARGVLQGIPEAARTAPRKPHVYSAAGKAVNRAKLEAARTPEQRKGAAEKARAATLAANQDKHREILRLFGEGMRFGDIASQVGCSRPMIRDTLARAGVRADGRRRRWAVMTEVELSENRSALQTAAARRQANLEDKRALIVAEYREGGSTYAEVRRLANVHKIAVGSMAAFLKKSGADVPDGRQDARPSRFSDDERAEMAKMYLEGASQSEVGRHFGASQSYVSAILCNAGIATREFRRPASSA